MRQPRRKKLDQPTPVLTPRDVRDRWMRWYEIDTAELAVTPRGSIRYKLLLQMIDLDQQLIARALDGMVPLAPLATLTRGRVP